MKVSAIVVALSLGMVSVAFAQPGLGTGSGPGTGTGFSSGYQGSTGTGTESGGLGSTGTGYGGGYSRPLPRTRYYDAQRVHLWRGLYRCSPSFSGAPTLALSTPNSWDYDIRLLKADRTPAGTGFFFRCGVRGCFDHRAAASSARLTTVSTREFWLDMTKLRRICQWTSDLPRP